MEQQVEFLTITLIPLNTRAFVLVMCFFSHSTGDTKLQTNFQYSYVI